MKNVIALILAGGMLSVSLHAAGDTKAGKVVYDAKCKTCHGANGEGVQAVAKALKVEFRHLGSKEVQSKSDDDLIKASIDGIGKMKPVKGIPEDRTQNLLAFLRSLAKK